MLRLLKASFFKLKKDLTLRITLIIGLALALFLSIIYFIIDRLVDPGFHYMATGQSMLINSFSPTQNFGIAIPINLVIFTISEFNQGTIRNKVVVGNSKLKIYTSLLLSGLIFTFALLISYVGLSTVLGIIFGRGFFPSYTGTDAAYMVEATKKLCASGAFISQYIVVGCLTYVTITTYTIFCGTLLRNVGPSIPLILIPMVLLAIIPMFTSPMGKMYLEYIAEAEKAKEGGYMEDYQYAMQAANSLKGSYIFDMVMQIIDPYYCVGSAAGTSSLQSKPDMSTNQFIFGVSSNIFWSAVFSVSGAAIFCHRDLK